MKHLFAELNYSAISRIPRNLRAAAARGDKTNSAAIRDKWPRSCIIPQLCRTDQHSRLPNRAKTQYFSHLNHKEYGILSYTPAILQGKVVKLDEKSVISSHKISVKLEHCGSRVEPEDVNTVTDCHSRRDSIATKPCRKIPRITLRSPAKNPSLDYQVLESRQIWRGSRSCG